MRETISFIIPNIFLFIYLVMSSIEYGISIFLLFPKLLNNDGLIRSYLNPVWESSNVFLVFYIVSLFTFFPKVIPQIGPDLLPILLTVMVLFIFRNASMMYVIFADGVSKLTKTILLVSSFASLIVFSWAYIYMLTGSNRIWSGNTLILAISLGAALILGAILLASAFFRYFSRQINSNHPLESMIHTVFVVFILALIALGFAAQNYAPALKHAPDSAAANISSLTAGSVIFLLIILLSVAWFYIAQNRSKWSQVFLSCAVLCAAAYFALISMQLPLIAYPNSTIYNSFIDYSVFKPMIISFIVGAIIIIPSLSLLFRLFIVKKDR